MSYPTDDRELNASVAEKALPGQVGKPAPGLVSAAELLELAALLEWSPRQHQIAQGLVAGQSVKEMAAQLGINVETIRDHKNRLFKKVGVETPIEFLTYLLRLILQLRSWK